MPAVERESARPRRYIKSHTSIRGIAALLVVLYHFQFGTSVYLPWERTTPFFKHGYVWVDLFFILSGFVISYAMRSDDKAPFDRPQIAEFWVHRFARIYPLHFACLFILLAVKFAEYGTLTASGDTSAIWPFAPPLAVPAFFEQLFLLQAWGITGRVTWNIPSWSISAEAVAYLLFPLLAAVIARWRRPALVAFTLLSLLFYASIGATTGSLDIVKGVAVLRCLAGFGLGMILYSTREKFAGMSDLTLSLLQLAGLAIALATLLLGLNDVLAIPGFFLLVAATWRDRGWLTGPLKTRPLHWLGEISYSVYLNHFWVLRAWHFVTDHLLKRLPVDLITGRFITLVGGMALVLGISHLTFMLIEGPARKAIVDRFRRREARRTISTLHA